MTTTIAVLMLSSSLVQAQTVIALDGDKNISESGEYVFNNAPDGTETGGTINITPTDAGTWTITNNASAGPNTRLSIYSNTNSFGTSVGLIHIINNGHLFSSGSAPLQFDPAGDITIDNNGTIENTSPDNHYGIWLRPDSAGRTLVINNNGLISAATYPAIGTFSSGSGSHPYASAVLNNFAGGSINRGMTDGNTVRGSAVTLYGTTTTLNNAGDITGNVTLGCSACNDSTLNWTAGTIAGDITMNGDQIAAHISSSGYDGAYTISAASDASSAELNLTNTSATTAVSGWMNFHNITLTNSQITISDSGSSGSQTNPSVNARDNLSLKENSVLNFATPSVWINAATTIDATSTVGLVSGAQADAGRLQFGAQLQLSGVLDLLGGSSTAYDQVIFNDHYLSYGGTIRLNSWLTGETASSWADQVILTGTGQAMGMTNLAITDLNTEDKSGLERVLVVSNQRTGTQPALPGSITAPTEPLSFRLANRVVSGSYEYRLEQDGQEWYLVNGLIDTPGPTPIIRVETGILAANAKGALDMFDHSWRDRVDSVQAVDQAGRRYWLRFDGHREKLHSERDQYNSTFERFALLGGADLHTSSTNGRDAFVVGAMLGYGRQHGRADSLHIDSHANGKLHGKSLGLYATWAQNGVAQPGLHVDAWLQRAHYNASLHGEDFQNSKYDMDTTTLSLETAFQSRASTRESYRSWLELQGQLMVSDFDMGSFKESGGASVSAKGPHTSARLGLRASMESLDAQHMGYAQLDVIDVFRSPQVKLDTYDIEKLDQNTYRITTGYEQRVSPNTVLNGNISYGKSSGSNHQSSAKVSVRHRF